MTLRQNIMPIPQKIKTLVTPKRGILMEESMKKVVLIALLAMMLLSMLAMSACKPKPAEEAPVEEVAPVETEEAVLDSVETDAAPVEAQEITE